MDKAKIKEVTTLYRARLGLTGDITCRQNNNAKFPADQLSHCMWMLGEIDRLADGEKLDKAFRWLGFVQGTLWSHNIYTIAQMRDHNRTESLNISEEQLRALTVRYSLKDGTNAPPHLTPLPGDDGFTVSRLAQLFVEGQRHWFQNPAAPGNSLYGRGQEAYWTIVEFLSTGKKPTMNQDMRYVLDKFETEFFNAYFSDRTYRVSYGPTSSF